MCRATRRARRRRSWRRRRNTIPTPTGSSASDGLILRSRAKRGVSKDRQHRDCGPPFETRPAGAPQGEVIFADTASLARELALQAGPVVEDGDDLLFARRRQREDDAIDADRLVQPKPLDIVGHAEQGDGQALGIAPGIDRHPVEFVDNAQSIALQPIVARDPTVAVANGAPRGMREGAADDDGRMGLLARLGPLLHLVEGDELAVIGGLLLGPDRLHRLDTLAGKLVPRLEGGAVVLDLVLVPAVADTEQKAAVRQLVDGRDE